MRSKRFNVAFGVERNEPTAENMQRHTEHRTFGVLQQPRKTWGEALRGEIERWCERHGYRLLRVYSTTVVAGRLPEFRATIVRDGVSVQTPVRATSQRSAVHRIVAMLKRLGNGAKCQSVQPVEEV